MNDIQLKFKFGNNRKEYEVDGIWDYMVYVIELVIGQLSELYYLIL